MADGYIGMFQRPLYPDPVESVSFNEVADGLELTWPIVVSGVSSYYEVWASVGDINNYNLVGVVSNIELYSGQEYITIVDKSYEASTDVYYKIYHVSSGYYSSVLESGIALSYSVPDPTNLEVAVALNEISLSWTNNDSRLLEAVSIVHHSASGLEDLIEASGTEVFRGMAGNFTYEVGSSGIEHWHQFWVSSVTRTTT